MTDTCSADLFSIRLGRTEDFTRVRTFLRDAAFNDTTLCRVLQMEDMSALGRVNWEKNPAAELSAPLRWAITVFARGLGVSEAESRSVCGDETLAAFRALGLLRPKRDDAALLVCPVWLYPADGFLVISDRTTDPDGGEFKAAEDVVFPAIYGGTLRFLRLLPEARGGEALDHCGGSGIGALRLARTFRVAATADLTERSAFFAEFNGRLNGVDIQSLCGDLYAPLAGRQFDLIAAHPPFVPATGTNMVYRDGGETGEEVTRRVIEGLPAHLRAGGTCVILCVARDTQEKPFELRVRDWLGEAADEFEIIFGLEKILSVDEVVESMRKRGQNLNDAAANQLRERLKSRGTRQFVYGATFLKRHAARARINPTRVRMNPEATAKDFERLFTWQNQTRLPGFNEWLVKSKPALAPNLELTMRHVVQNGELTPVEFVFSVQGGFPAALRPDGFVVPLVARLDGKKSVEEVFAAALSGDELPQGFKLEDFTGLVRGMIERGFLLVELRR